MINKMETDKIKLHPAMTCKLTLSAIEISKKLKEANERRIFVVSDDEKLMGIITTTDLVYRALVENPNATAEEVMTKDVQSIDVMDSLEKSIEIMNKIKSFSCPVTKDGKIVGLISYHDVINHVINPGA